MLSFIFCFFIYYFSTKDSGNHQRYNIGLSGTDSLTEYQLFSMSLRIACSMPMQFFSKSSVYFIVSCFVMLCKIFDNKNYETPLIMILTTENPNALNISESLFTPDWLAFTRIPSERASSCIFVTALFFRAATFCSSHVPSSM